MNEGFITIQQTQSLTAVLIYVMQRYILQSKQTFFHTFYLYSYFR